MAFANIQNADRTAQQGGVDALLNKNALTTAGVIAGGLTFSYGAMVVTAALPVKMLGGAALTATLLIAGDQQTKGNLKVPSFGKKQETVTKEVTEVSAEA